MNRLPVENPAVRRIAAQFNLPITTDQEGKDGGDTDTGIMVESRYWVGDIKFLSPTKAFMHVVEVLNAR